MLNLARMSQVSADDRMHHQPDADEHRGFDGGHAYVRLNVDFLDDIDAVQDGALRQHRQ